MVPVLYSTEKAKAQRCTAFDTSNVEECRILRWEFVDKGCMTLYYECRLHTKGGALV